MKKVQLTASNSMVPGAGLEPARSYLRGIFLPTTAFAAAPRGHIWGLDFLFTVPHSLRVRQEP